MRTGEGKWKTEVPLAVPGTALMYLHQTCNLQPCNLASSLDKTLIFRAPILAQHLFYPLLLCTLGKFMTGSGISPWFSFASTATEFI